MANEYIADFKERMNHYMPSAETMRNIAGQEVPDITEKVLMKLFEYTYEKLAKAALDGNYRTSLYLDEFLQKINPGKEITLYHYMAKTFMKKLQEDETFVEIMNAKGYSLYFPNENPTCISVYFFDNSDETDDNENSKEEK